MSYNSGSNYACNCKSAERCVLSWLIIITTIIVIVINIYFIHVIFYNEKEIPEVSPVKGRW